MDNIVKYILVGLFMLLVLSLMRYVQNRSLKNNFKSFLDDIDADKYLVIKSAKIGISEKIKFFVDGLVISSRGVFIVLYSDLRGQLHINDDDENMTQVIVRNSYQIKNPIYLVLKIKSLFHKYMNIHEDYLKPVVVFDKQTELRNVDQSSVPVMKMQDLKAYIESQEEQQIPEDILRLIKEQFQKQKL